MPAVAEDRAIVREFGDLAHAVRDIDQRQPLGAQVLQHAEHGFDILGRQGRGGFVQDEEARVTGQRLGDFDELAAREGQVAHERQGMDPVGTGAGQGRFGEPPLSLAVDQAEAHRRVRDQDVVGHRKVGDERQFLEDADDTGRVGGGRCREAYGVTVEFQRSGVGLDDARHAFDQARLAGAVLAQHRVDAARVNREVHAFERPDAAVTLGDAGHPEQWRGHDETRLCRGRGTTGSRVRRSCGEPEPMGLEPRSVADGTFDLTLVNSLACRWSQPHRPSC